MICNILSELNIDSYAFISADCCIPKNLRLHAAIPDGCQVIFLLFPYYTGAQGGCISKYASVYDYHDFAKEVFSRLEAYFKDHYPNAYAKGFSDHSPYAECNGACKAGLGIIGKNSLLINEKYSSFVFIGELVTDLSREELLLEGIPEGDGSISYCEGCGLCSLSCPAGCVEGDSRTLCASAVSQKKGELSEEEALILKKAQSIWGCDRCQDVCPHTKKAIETGTIYTQIDFFKNSFIGNDPARAILDMDDDTFRLYPFSWRRRSVIERNIKLLTAGDIENG